PSLTLFRSSGRLVSFPGRETPRARTPTLSLHDALPIWDWPNLVSSIGSFVMAAGVATCLLDLLLHMRVGKPAGSNPWRADTLEWATTLPPASYNFNSLPDVKNRHPLWRDPGLPQSIARGEQALVEIDHGRRETWGVDALTGRVRDITHLPGNSWIPLIAALLLAGLCLSLLAKLYALALAVSGAVLLVLLLWSWLNGPLLALGASLDSLPRHPPLHWRTLDGP